MNGKKRKKDIKDGIKPVCLTLTGQVQSCLKPTNFFGQAQYLIQADRCDANNGQHFFFKHIQRKFQGSMLSILLGMYIILLLVIVW